MKPLLPRQQAPKRDGDQAKKAAEKRRFLWQTVLLSIPVYALYVILTNLPIYKFALILYMTVFAVTLIGYVFYNHGFTENHLTYEMLPDIWSEEEKKKFLSAPEERKKKSRWCLFIIFPLLVTFLLDAFLLFLFEPYILPFFIANLMFGFL